MVKTTEYYCYILFRNIAEFPRQFYVGSLAAFAKTKGSFASYFYTYFFLKMANAGKVSITANDSTRIARTSHTFRVKIHSYYSFDDGHRDEYTLDTVVAATSRAEAIGKAIISALAIHLSFGGCRICEQLD